MSKFQRNYTLHVQGADMSIYTFTYPMTLEFNIESRAFPYSAGTGHFRIYNLSKDTRKIVYKDPFTKILRTVVLEAGYGDNLYRLFYGNIKQAMSYREEGSVNFITEIEGFDWSFGMTETDSNFTLNASPSSPLYASTIIDRLIEDLTTSGISRGIVNKAGFDIGGPICTRPFVASGNTWQILKNITNGNCFISSGVVHCLLDDDYIVGSIPKIDSSTGLLSTPRKSGTQLTIDMLFEPSLALAQRLELLGQSEPLYNGTYKVLGISHRGVISGAVNGKCTTSVVLNAGEIKLNLLTNQFESFPIGS